MSKIKNIVVSNTFFHHKLKKKQAAPLIPTADYSHMYKVGCVLFILYILIFHCTLISVYIFFNFSKKLFLSLHYHRTFSYIHFIPEYCMWLCLFVLDVCFVSKFGFDSLNTSQLEVCVALCKFVLAE